MSAADLLVRGTACMAFVLYVAALVLGKRPDWSRGLWTTGCLVFWLHVACAFQFVHHWSHAEAFEATARQTLETTGVASGALFWPAWERGFEIRFWASGPGQVFECGHG